MASLSREELARAKFTFSIYDFDGTNKIDAFQLGNALRAMNLFPSLKRISNLGGTIQRNEKLLSVEEFLAIYEEAKKDKQEGVYESYLEVLGGYDKDRSGKISVTTLHHLLQGYGQEKLTRDEAEEVIEDCGKPDDEGYVNYRKFLDRLMEGPEIKIPIAMLRATETETDSGFGTPAGAVSRKNTHRKSQGSIAPPSLNEEVIKEKLSSEGKEKVKTGNSQTSSVDEEKVASEANQEEENPPSTKRKSSQKSNASQRKRENSIDICSELPVDDVPVSKEAVDADVEVGEGDGEAEDDVTLTTSARSSRKSTGKRSSKKASSPDTSVASDTSGGGLMSARSSLKSGKSTRSSTKTSDGKEESVKAKFQQPLISLKTDGLFGKK